MKLRLLGVIGVLFAPAEVFAADMPQIKAGLWEVTVQQDGAPQQTLKQCVDADTAQKMLTAGQKMMGKRCSDIEMSQSGGDFISEIECNLGGSKMVAKTTLSGKFDEQYTSETVTTFEPPMMGQDKSVSLSTNRWLGECEAGMRPGDTVMADGRKMNVLDMMEQMPDMSQLENLQQGAGEGGADMKKLQEQMKAMEQQMKQAQ